MRNLSRIKYCYLSLALPLYQKSSITHDHVLLQGWHHHYNVAISITNPHGNIVFKMIHGERYFKSVIFLYDSKEQLGAVRRVKSGTSGPKPHALSRIQFYIMYS